MGTVSFHRYGNSVKVEDDRGGDDISWIIMYDGTKIELISSQFQVELLISGVVDWSYFIESYQYGNLALLSKRR